MKSPVTVAIISLVCLFAFFHSCHGIICYFCHSMNYENKKCENITDEKYMFDYGDYAKYCMKMVSYDTHDKSFNPYAKNVTERLLRRCGYTDESYPKLLEEEEKERGYKVKISTCKEDRCNGN